MEDKILVQTNEYQTPITEGLLSQYPDEVREQFMEFISTVPFIQNLISPSRPRIEELPRDEQGRAIVDITNPPTFENADYFRQSALYFLKEGVYTKLRPNPNPNSEYRKFWDMEIERCYNGLLRESDGMWIPGYLYWFLNYCPMMINEYQKGKKKAIRKEGFGLLFEGIWLRYLYLRDSRENGHHAAELAKRGAHPYFQKVYTPDGIKEWGEIKIGDRLYGTNGVTTKVVDIPFDDLADTYKITLRDGREVYASDDHIWNVIRANTGKVLHLNTEYLYNHYISKRKKSWRNPSGKAYIYFIPNNLGVEYNYYKVSIDAYTLGILLGDGCFRNKNYKNQVIFTSAKRDIDTYKKYSPYIIDKISSDEYTYAIRVNTQYLYECNLWGCKSEDKFIPNIYKYNSRQVRLNILKGLMDTDGSVHGNTPIFNTSSKRLAEDVIEISRSLGYNCNMTTRKSGYKVKGLYKKCLNTYEVSIYGGKDIFNLERKKELIDECNITSRSYKTCITNIEYIGKYPCKCVTVDAFDNSYLIGDFVQTHNCGKSYSLASIMSKNLILGESKETNRRNITVLTAYQKEYLKDDKDGTLSKFVPILSHLSKYTPFPRLMLKQSSNEMTWQMGYKDDYGRPQGSLNQVMGVSAKDDSDKLRGKRGWILYEEFGNFNGLLELYDVTRKSVEDGDYTFACQYLIGCVCAGTKVWTNSGRYINIEELTPQDGIVGFTDSLDLYDIHLVRGTTKEPIVSPIYTGEKECVRITLSNGNSLECSIDHPILIHKRKCTHTEFLGYTEIFREAGKLKVGDRVLESREIPIFGTDTLFDARCVGMLIGDGTYGSSVKYYSEDKELLDYLKSKYKCPVFRSHITKKGKLYEEIRVNGIRGFLNKIGILGQTKINKRLPINYQTLSESDIKLLLSGLYDTDGCVYINKNNGYITLTQSNKEILEQIKILWRKFGVIGTIIKTNPNIREDRKDKNPWFTFTISGRHNCLKAAKVLNLLVPHKSNRLLEIEELYQSSSVRLQSYSNDVLMYKIVKIENIGIKTIYNLTAGLSHTYLANNIITHNTANNKESNFQSAKTLLYAPNSYNIQEVKNVYDKKGQGRDYFAFFFPAYLNRAGCFNKDGISDVVMALLQILNNRYKAKYGADPTSVLRVIAEDPITPAEAIIKVKDAYFNVQALNERAHQLDTNPRLYDDVYVGRLFINSNGEVEFSPTNDIPIRKYPVDNDTQGALEIYNMPEKDSSNKVFNNRYIIGVDPVDNDVAESSSLYSCFVFDLFTDNIVAEYTGRNTYANDNFEITRLLCKFYNAKALYESNKKGIFGYFQSLKCIHLLAETPEYLRDKQFIKYSNIGSNAYGVNASAAINNYANSLLKDWLNKLIPIVQVNENGEEVISQMPILYTLKTRALIEEAIQFNPEINADRIRAMGMVMIYRQEYIIKYGDNMNAESRERVRRDDPSNDPFFKKNYDYKCSFNKKGVI